MNQFIRLCTIMFTLLLVNLSFIPAFFAVTTTAQTEITESQITALQPEPEDPATMDLQQIKFFMRKGKSLHPESPPMEETPKTVSCPSKTEPFHPILPGKILRFFVWQPLPVNFETHQVNRPVRLGHQVHFKLWFESSEENIDNIQFIFTLLHNNNPIAKTEAVRYRAGNSNTLETGADGFVTANAGINISNNQISVGDTLEMHMDYMVNGDGLKIKFDNPVYDSGMQIQANPITIEEIRASPSKITAFYNEAFNVRTSTLLFLARVDEQPVDTEHQSGSSSEGRFVYWETALKTGTHTIIVYISYGSSNNESMVMDMKEVTIKIHKHWTFLGLHKGTWIFLITLLILVIVILIIVRIWRSRRLEAQLLESYNY